MLYFFHLVCPITFRRHGASGKHLAASFLILAALVPSYAQSASILVLGDSISAAYGMSLEQGWVAQMAIELEKDHPDSAVINASISGETTAGGLRRLPALLKEHSPSIVIIELGGNDGLRGYPLNKFRENLETLVTLSTNSGASAILVPMEIPPNYGSRYTAGFRESYRTVAAATGASLAPFILDGIATQPSLMQEDGIHPTAEAQPLLLRNMLAAVLAAVEKL